ncbi:COX15/CtaA family protein [Tumebacillus permanentifrigoris]|uniref:Cytochrome c oxidase assembly protein subunit 15 n=1 Tax=Tumebacillus permanentifrigoris TaxID=378543 RepID=A0A316D9W3_9BACL|nr:COX15/CtaA family protein [Tumebacillus permanentifrigoris]PWK13138.1 cytochrome c oxidase assembly protein subunit 15 [Tumebacillus permanentifrigoris]
MGYRLPLVTTIVTFLMMILGAVVVGTQAGFACPDWPLCHGQIIPPLDDPLVIIEWFHRTTSGLGGILILLTAFQAWRHRKQSSLYTKFAVATVLCLGLQALAGAAIVVFKLPGYMTTIDVTNGMFLISIFAALTALGFRNRELAGNRVTEEQDARLASLFVPSALMVGVTILQVIVGGLFRHTGASEALFGRNDYIRNHFQDHMPSEAFANGFLMFHIMITVLVVAATAWVVAQAFRNKVLIAPALALVVIVLMQMLLGFVTLGTELALSPATSHLGGAALTMVFGVYIGARAHFAKTVKTVTSISKTGTGTQANM